MTKLTFLPILLILFTLLSACNSDEKKIVIMEDLNNPSREEIRAKTQNQPDNPHLISKEVGIGAARKQFNQAYGKNYGDLEIARYQGEFMVVTFEQHRAINLQYQFAYKPGKQLSNEQITSYIEDRIPQDAVEIKRVTNDANQKITEYRSETLANTLANYSFRGDEPGRFVVILNKDEDGQVSVTVTLGSTHG